MEKELHKHKINKEILDTKWFFFGTLRVECRGKIEGKILCKTEQNERNCTSHAK